MNDGRVRADRVIWGRVMAEAGRVLRVRVKASRVKEDFFFLQERPRRVRNKLTRGRRSEILEKKGNI